MSAPGQGTTFEVYLPTASPDEVASPLVGAGAPEAARILIVDDDSKVAKALARVATALGHQVTITLDPHDAIARVQHGEHFDLVLTDWQMPALSGVELARVIRAARRDLPVVVMTGGLPELPADLRKDVGVSLLPKPITRDQLSRHLASRLGGVSTKV